MKKGKDVEKYFKGVANHRRIDVLTLVSHQPGINLEDIADHLSCNFQTIAVHVQKLSRADLVDKKYIGRAVGHTLSPKGKKFLAFIQTL